MSAESQEVGPYAPLAVKVDASALTITIGVNQLAYGVMASVLHWPEGWAVTDPDKFARSMAKALEREDSSGTTALDDTFDQAAHIVIENDWPGVTEGGDREVALQAVSLKEQDQ